MRRTSFLEYPNSLLYTTGLSSWALASIPRREIRRRLGMADDWKRIEGLMEETPRRCAVTCADLR